MYDHICESKKCKFFIVWNFGYQDCCSCTKIGQSYNVIEYPDDCTYKAEMIKEDLNPTTNESKQ